MPKSEFCQLWLTCADGKEASKIADTLLVKHLTACAKQIPLAADYWWEDKIEHTDEILLVMESREDLFDQVEHEVAKLHSYDTFVLEATPVLHVSKKAVAWLKEELQNA